MIEEIILKLKYDESTQIVNMSVSMKMHLDHCTSRTNLHLRSLNEKEIVTNECIKFVAN